MAESEYRHRFEEMEELPDNTDEILRSRGYSVEEGPGEVEYVAQRGIDDELILRQEDGDILMESDSGGGEVDYIVNRLENEASQFSQSR